MSNELPVFEVTVSREDNLWVAVVTDLPGGATDVDHFEDLPDAVRDLVATLTEIEPEDFWISWRYLQGSHELTEKIQDLRQWEQQAQLAVANRDAARQAAIEDMRNAGLSYREISDVVGISYQRVAQLLDRTGTDKATGREAFTFQSRWPLERRSALLRALKNKVAYGEPLHLKPLEAALLLVLDNALDVSPSSRQDLLKLLARVLENAANDRDFIQQGGGGTAHPPSACA
jgi:hypothetical protein